MTTPDFTYNAVVRRVVDGDTIILDIDLGFETWLHARSIRLLGVLAPEIRGPERPLGMKVKAELQKILPVGKKIVLESEKDSTDKYGRYLGVLYADGQNVNAAVSLIIEDVHAIDRKDA